jgi:Uma2 family endonuclease
VTVEPTNTLSRSHILGDHLWTREERDSIPPDRHRYEVIDGALVVTPPPWTGWHALACSYLLTALHGASPPGIDALPGPFDVILGSQTFVIPDIVVAPRSAFTEVDLPVPPALIVEVSHDISRDMDLGLKRACFERAGVTSYWVFDVEEVRLRAWDLDADGTYTLVADVRGDESWTATLPYPVTITPADALHRSDGQRRRESSR